MTEISEKEIEAAREAWREYWCEEDVPRNTRDGMTAALSAAARVRAEANAGEPVAWGEDIDGKIVSVRLDKSRHCTVPLYPAPQPSGTVEVKGRKALVEKYASAVKRLGREIVGMPECVIRQHFDEFLDEALSALTAGKPEQAVPCGWRPIARPLEEWHEDYGDAVWWTWQDGQWLGEPSYIGTPNDSDWPGYHTHWTPHPIFPTPPTAGGGDAE